MFGNGDVSAFGGSLTFIATLPDGRSFGVVILPDEQHESRRPRLVSSNITGNRSTPAVVWSYLPNFAGITWRPPPPTFFGRTEERGTNGTFRVGLLAGREGPGAATPDEMRGWFAANVYGLVPKNAALEPGVIGAKGSNGTGTMG